jgi:hypothetical protein
MKIKDIVIWKVYRSVYTLSVTQKDGRFSIWNLQFTVKLFPEILLALCSLLEQNS